GAQRRRESLRCEGDEVERHGKDQFHQEVRERRRESLRCEGDAVERHGKDQFHEEMRDRRGALKHSARLRALSSNAWPPSKKRSSVRQKQPTSKRLAFCYRGETKLRIKDAASQLNASICR